MCVGVVEVLKSTLVYRPKPCPLTSSARLPTWIEKLSQLGIRKYVTKDEWCKIYLHCRTRLEDPTRTRGDLKLKRTKKKTEIVVRDMLFTWDKAWKNMKSAGAVGQLPESGGKPIDTYYYRTTRAVFGTDMLASL